MYFTARFRKLFVLFLLLGISSLGENRASPIDVARFLGGAFLPEKNLTMQDGETWYAVNKKALMELHQLVLQYPAVRRVDPGRAMEFVPNSDIFNAETMAAYKKAEIKCQALNIMHIAIFREDSDELISARYTLSSSGLAVSGGKAVSIEFVPDKLLIPRFFPVPENVVKALDEENWYLVDYQEGRK